MKTEYRAIILSLEIVQAGWSRIYSIVSKYGETEDEIFEHSRSISRGLEKLEQIFRKKEREL